MTPDQKLQALFAEADQRIAHGGLAHAEALREVGPVQGTAGRQLQRHDGRAQGLDNLGCGVAGGV